ncbi:ras-like protein 2, partial [Nephila pilipes]
IRNSFSCTATATCIALNSKVFRKHSDLVATALTFSKLDFKCFSCLEIQWVKHSPPFSSSEASSTSVTRKDVKRKRRSAQNVSAGTEELNPCSCTGVFEALRCCFCASAHRKSSDPDTHSHSLMSKSQLSSPPIKTQVVVLGPSRVGKTALVLRYLRRHFEADYEPTIEDVYSKKIRMPDGEVHEVLITDTAGSLLFPDLREDSIRSADGFVIVFALNSVESLRDCIQICDQILNLRGNNASIVLVGNKTDLINERQVSPEMVQEVVNQRFRSYVYIETSAKLKQNIKQIFIELIQLLSGTQRIS